MKQRMNFFYQQYKQSMQTLFCIALTCLITINVSVTKASANSINSIEKVKKQIPNYLTKTHYTIYPAKKRSHQDLAKPASEPTQSFSCKEQMFAVVKVDNPEYRLNHTVMIPASVKWINPNGNIQEQTSMKIPLFQGQANTFAWLKLHQPSGASMLSFIDSTMGLEKFIGEWTIRLVIDNTNITDYKFNVIC